MNVRDYLLQEYTDDQNYMGTDYEMVYGRNGVPKRVEDGYTGSIKGRAMNALDRGQMLFGEAVEEVGVPVTKGLIQIFEGVTSLPLALLEKTNFVNQGVVGSYAQFFEDMVYPKVEEIAKKMGADDGKPDSPLAPFIQTLTQYGVPGVGFYKLAGNMMKFKPVTEWYNKALQNVAKTAVAEKLTVLTAQDPVDGNFATFVSDVFDMPRDKAESSGRELFNYISSPATETTASTVIEERLKAILADVPLALGLDTTVQLLKGYAKLYRRNEQVRQIEKTTAVGLGAPEIAKDEQPQEPTTGPIVSVEDAMGNQYNFTGEQVTDTNNGE